MSGWWVGLWGGGSVVWVRGDDGERLGWFVLRGELRRLCCVGTTRRFAFTL